MKRLKALILAAGEGSRMKSKNPKVLHEVAGRSLLGHVLHQAQEAGIEERGVIVGHQKEKVTASLPEDVCSFVQEEQLGTGHAVMMAEDFLQDDTSDVLILCGDAPLTEAETLRKLADFHQKQNNDVTVMSAHFENPFGYGRIIRDDKGELLKIVEQKDATEEEKAVQEINSGVYLFDSKALREALKHITSANAQKEYYLTDAIEIIKSMNGKAGVYQTEDPEDIAAVNSKAQLAEVGEIFRKRINQRLMDEGVILIDPKASYIDDTVQIGRDTVVYPGAILEGNTVIGEDCVIGANTHIVNSRIADSVDIANSTILDSQVAEGAHVGPYAYIRPGSQIGEGCKVGDFVEVKNSIMKEGAKASHLTYIGDAEVGRNVNLGCGTVFVNYDGKDKHRIQVGDDCFIGCNTNLISPVTVGDGAFIAAGSTITDDVPADALSIARARQINKEDYAKKMPPAMKKAETAEKK